MRRYLTIFLAVAAVAVLPATAVAKPANFTATGKQTSVHPTAKSFSFTENVSQGHKVIGTDKVTCKNVRGVVFNCAGTFAFTFHKGGLKVSGQIDQSKPTSTIKITGGSGAFKGAKGTLTLKFTGPTTTVETFKFK